MAATTLKEAVIQALNKAASSFYTAQTLTEEQQAQARTNIGAMSAETSTSVPAGTMLPFAGTEVPDGYLLCNGANVSRTDYANLFAAIGTKWGEGDGSTTFTLPNFNDRFIEGTTDTSKVGQYLEAGAPNITGKWSASKLIGEGATVSSSGALYNSATHNNVTSGGSYGTYFGIGLDASRISTVYSNAITIQPQSGYTFIIIRT